MLDPDRYERFFRDFYEKHGVRVDAEFIGRLQDELLDTFESEIEDEWEDLARALIDRETPPEELARRLRAERRFYMKELRLLQKELVKLQDWVVETGEKIVVIFEGRDAAGKGGVIKRITERLNPRTVRVVALSKPTQEEKSQWYFQRYVTHLPSAGQIVLFDRSWYNRAGVERVMDFATESEVAEFFRTAPQFEEMLIGSGIRLVKYWFSVSDQEQEFRFLCRIHDPLKQWKLSPMDLQSRVRWEDYTKAKEEMMERTSTEFAPWHIVTANDKKKSRLNCIAHLLSLFTYVEIEREEVTLPERSHHEGYRRMELTSTRVVPERY
jgi:polyphosphate kinase